MASQNIYLHNEIRSWNTDQLIQMLESNGLGECCNTISIKQIDGEEFLNLSENQLSLWRNMLNVTQSKRLWSFLQLIRERPQDFVINGEQPPIFNYTDHLFPTFNNEYPMPPSTRVVQPPKSKENVPIPATSNFGSGRKVKSPFAVDLNSLLSQKLAEKHETAPPTGVKGNCLNDVLQQKLSPHLYLPEASSFEQPPVPKSRIQKHEFAPAQFTALPSSSQARVFNDFVTPPLPTRPNNLPSPALNDRPFIPSIEPMKNEMSPTDGPKSLNLPRPPKMVLLPVNSEVDHEYAECNFVDKTQENDYRIQSWYKNVDRREANMLLRGQPNGSFLVRPGNLHECCFSVMCKGRVYNIGVRKQGAKFVMGKLTFDNIPEIVDRLTDIPLVLNASNNETLSVRLRRN